MTQEIWINWLYVHVRHVVNVSFYINIEFCSGIHKVNNKTFDSWRSAQDTRIAESKWYGNAGKTHLNQTISDTTREIAQINIMMVTKW